MSLNLIKESESQIPFFLKNHLTPWLDESDRKALSITSRHNYIHSISRSDLLRNTELNPDRGVRKIKGLRVLECACREETSRIAGKMNWREIFESRVLQTIQNRFPEKKEIRFCFIAAGYGLQALVILQQLPKIKKTAHSLLLVDPLFESDSSEEDQIVKDLSEIAQSISPISKVKTKASLEDLVQSNAIEKTDVFVLFDSDYLAEPSDPAFRQEWSLKAKNQLMKIYLPQFYLLENAIRASKGPKLLISGEWDVGFQKGSEATLAIRVLFKDPTAKEHNSLYVNGVLASDKEFLVNSISNGYWPTAIRWLRQTPCKKEDQQAALAASIHRETVCYSSCTELSNAIEEASLLDS